VLRQEPLCQKGLFVVCPTPVYRKIGERLGGGLRPYPIQPGSLTIMWYDIGPEVQAGHQRELLSAGKFTTTIDQVALAFTSPSNLPPPLVYENAIRASLQHWDRRNDPRSRITPEKRRRRQQTPGLSPIGKLPGSLQIFTLRWRTMVQDLADATPFTCRFSASSLGEGVKPPATHLSAGIYP